MHIVSREKKRTEKAAIEKWKEHSLEIDTHIHRHSHTLPLLCRVVYGWCDCADLWCDQRCQSYFLSAGLTQVCCRSSFMEGKGQNIFACCTRTWLLQTAGSLMWGMQGLIRNTPRTHTHTPHLTFRAWVLHVCSVISHIRNIMYFSKRSRKAKWL